MARNPDHEMLSKPTHDERARQSIVGSMKLFFGRQLRPGNRAFFELEAKPEFARTHGREPESVAEIGEAMHGNFHWQLWSALQRAGQEMMWASVADTLLRDEPRLKSIYSRLTASKDRKGSLDLDPEFEIPEVIRETEIHLQPGGYALDRGNDDFLAGAFYETGGAIYSRAQGVGTKESKGEIIVRFLDERYPRFQPSKILDMACSAGSSSTPYAQAFPDAEVHAVDVAPGLLRYAHARAEAMGLSVHFHQRSVVDTRFDDASFDLVVSHNAMHEMSDQTATDMMRESYRLLRPGGVCVHQDVPLRYSTLDEFAQVDFGWDRDYNGEVFWEVYATNDCQAMLEAAGFSPDEIFVGVAGQADGKWNWYVACARK
jgi:SAM-dependent methyltransferase